VPLARAASEEPPVGQERRPGEVVGEPDERDRAGLLGAEPGEVERRLDQLAVGDQRDLVQHLEGLGRRPRRGVEGQPPRAPGRSA
jgi:hypothetical protein